MLRKVWAIAAREYKAAVKTKAFVISLVLVPVLWAVSIGIQVLMRKAEDQTTKKFAVVNRTAEPHILAALQAANTIRSERGVFSEETGEQVAPKFEFMVIEPSADDPAAVQKQRYELSQRCQAGEFEGFLDIGPDVVQLAPPPGPGQRTRS